MGQFPRGRSLSMALLLRSLKAACAALALGLAVTAAAQDQAADKPSAPDLALMGTIPIYWGEAADLQDLISGTHRIHWARAQLERSYRLFPLDYLTAATLAPHTHLLLAQPRGFSAEENVALDQWVRGGGRLLLFADPMMTGETRFGLGDRRRPQDVALLSPILAHWGLRLEYAEGQAGLIMHDIGGSRIPVNLAGRFSLTGEGGDCALEGQAILAVCTIGRGRITVLADAALLDLDGPHIAADTALNALAARAFSENGDIAGSAESQAGFTPENGENPPHAGMNAEAGMEADPPT